MGTYRLAMIDPPWRFEPYSRDSGLDKSPDAHYQTMTFEEMAELPVKYWLADNAYVALWVYDPMLPDAFALAGSWDLTFVTVLFRWLKTTPKEDRSQLALFPIEPPTTAFGTGYHTRKGGCEELWLFKRGKGLPVLRHDIRCEFYSPVREHSRKPDEVADWLVDLYGDVPRLEMFARTRRPGWDVYGNETTKFTLPPGDGIHGTDGVSA